MAVTTHSFKYKPTTAPSGTEDRVLACSHTTDDCHCVINTSGQIGYYVSGVFTQIGTATVSLNEQYAFIIEHDDSGNGCIYLNGQKIGCATNFPTSAINQIGNFKTELKPEIGRKPKVGLKPRAVSNIYTRPCCGIIDEYARFNRALSASEIVDLSQSGTLSKVYTLADYKIALMADDGIIATTEKPRYKENWRSIWNADQRTSALPTAIASITVNGSYKSLATSANDAGIWTPTTNGTPAYDYYQAVESWRKMFFVSSGGGTGFLLTANLAGDSDISSMSPTLEARQSALMFAEDALRSAVMIKRQSTAELTSVANANAYTDELEDALRSQTDHAIVFTTSASDPSTGWTAEEKLIHKGDYWRVDTSSAWKTWTGTTWGTVNDAQAQAAASAAASAASTAQTSANNAQEIANAKRRVFTTTPTSPYDVGDLWVAGSSGDIKRCIIARATGSYTASEWDIASKYTDDTTANLKSRTYIQASAPSIGLNAGDYWLDSDDGYKPYVYKYGAWAVDQAMQTAINAGTAASNAQSSANDAQSTANAKTTLYGTLASAKLAAKTGDQFFYNSEIYVCTDDLAATARRYTTKSYGNSATAPAQTTQTVSDSVLTEPLNFGDTYFNTTTKKFYTYTTSWVEDTATSNSVIAYAPKYLGRYYQSHPGAPNNGDWWLVYGLASSPITRGFWYNNNGTNTLVSTLGTEAQRKYKGSGLEDVLYASNNGYALTSGGVYDPVAVYGVNTMELLAVNQAFIKKLVTQQLQFQEYVASIAGDSLVPRSGSTPGTQQIYMGKNPRYPDDASRAYEFALQEYLGMDGNKEVWMKHFWTRILASGVAALTLAGCIQANDGIQSKPGVVWKELADPFGTSSVRGIAYGNGKWVAVGESGKIAYSTDGQTFVLGTSPFGASGVFDIAYGNGKWVAVGYNGKIAYSTDGQTFVLGTSPFGASYVYDIAYGNGKWVAVGYNGKIAYSTDGQTFTLGTSPFGASYVRGIAYGNGKWVAVGESGKIAYSTDGQTFVLGTSPFGASGVFGIAYGNGKWVAVGDSGKIAYSTDGQTFVLGTSPFGASGVYDIAYGNGKWVAVGDNGKIAYSTDGEVFGSNNLQQPFGTRGWFYGVACNEDGVFIDVGYLQDGSGGIIIRSDPLEAGGGVVGKVYDTARGELNKLWDGRYFPSYASVDEIAPKKYFRFPAGTLNTTVAETLVPLLKRSGQHVTCIGSFGLGHYPAIIAREGITIIRIWNTAVQQIFAVSIGDSGTISDELQLEFILPS